MKYKKSITGITATLLLLALLTVSYLALDNWYQTYNSNLQTKKLYSNSLDSENIDVFGLKLESGNYNLYLRNHLGSYFVIDTIKVNSNTCTMPDNNVILPRDRSIIRLNCSSYSQINEIAIFSQSGIINEKVKLQID